MKGSMYFPQKKMFPFSSTVVYLSLKQMEDCLKTMYSFKDFEKMVAESDTKR